jgi:DNA-binding protein YbaB
MGDVTKYLAEKVVKDAVEAAVATAVEQATKVARERVLAATASWATNAKAETHYDAATGLVVLTVRFDMRLMHVGMKETLAAIGKP